jgi:hypothetical protein
MKSYYKINPLPLLAWVCVDPNGSIHVETIRLKRKHCQDDSSFEFNAPWEKLRKEGFTVKRIKITNFM